MTDWEIHRLSIDPAYARAQNNNGWIACSKRMPSETGEYLITNGDEYIVAFWGGEEIWRYADTGGQIARSFATHWQPLPEPPK